MSKEELKDEELRFEANEVANEHLYQEFKGMLLRDEIVELLKRDYPDIYDEIEQTLFEQYKRDFGGFD